MKKKKHDKKIINKSKEIKPIETEIVQEKIENVPETVLTEPEIKVSEIAAHSNNGNVKDETVIHTETKPEEKTENNFPENEYSETNKINETENVNHETEIKYNKDGSVAKKRGRKLGQNKTPDFRGSENELTKSVNDANQKRNEEKQNENPVSSISHLVTGYLLLTVIDFVAPNTMLFLFKKFDDKYKTIKAKDIRMDKDEIEKLEPLADAVVKELILNMKPSTALLICLASIYGGKIMALKD